MTRLNGHEDDRTLSTNVHSPLPPRPLTTSDCDLLMSKRPHHVAEGKVGDNRWWAARYDGFDQILVTVWAGEGFVFKQINVWFPAATPDAIEEWVATLPPPTPRARPERAHLDRRPDDPDVAA